MVPSFTPFTLIGTLLPRRFFFEVQVIIQLPKPLSHFGSGKPVMMIDQVFIGSDKVTKEFFSTQTQPLINKLNRYIDISI